MVIVGVLGAAFFIGAIIWASLCHGKKKFEKEMDNVENDFFQRELEQFHIPVSGSYKFKGRDCRRCRCLRTRESTMELIFTADDNNCGWKVSGSGQDLSNQKFNIEKGFVSPSGQAFWVQKAENAKLKRVILVKGSFDQSCHFEGSWCSDCGWHGSFSFFHPDQDNIISYGSS